MSAPTWHPWKTNPLDYLGRSLIADDGKAVRLDVRINGEWVVKHGDDLLTFRSLDQVCAWLGGDRRDDAAGAGGCARGAELMRFGSLFSGIGGFDLGFERAGMTCAWQVERDLACQAVLRAHFQAEVFRDVKDRNSYCPVDVICGGFPCQDVSISGLRKGLAGERSGLWFEFHRIIGEVRPRWVVIENVPGLLSSNRGGDFFTIISGLVECGYGAAWRVLDSQYFGVPQRRRRLFIVGSLGDGSAAEILFEREGDSWDSSEGDQEDEVTLFPTLCVSNRIPRHPSHVYGWGSDSPRMLTPVERERLQGFPDGWTGGQSDTARYRQLGNAVTVPVAEWIGRRIYAAAHDPAD